MVLDSSFSEEELTELAARSASYVEELKKAIPDIIAAMPAARMSPAEFHLAATHKAWEHLTKVQKQPGPWLSHMIRLCVYNRCPTYRAYIVEMYL
jgi:hypothetical protein